MAEETNKKVIKPNIDYKKIALRDQKLIDDAQSKITLDAKGSVCRQTTCIDCVWASDCNAAGHGKCEEFEIKLNRVY